MNERPDVPHGSNEVYHLKTLRGVGYKKTKWYSRRRANLPNWQKQDEQLEQDSETGGQQSQGEKSKQMTTEQ